MLEKISILIPVYNREVYLSQALDSAIAQTYSNLDIIVYNDGSKDRSDSIIKEYQAKDSRIVYINNPQNNGVSYARNVLLDSCKTKYAMWLDSDDRISHKKVEIQYAVMNGGDKIIFTDWHWLKFCNNTWINEKKIHIPQAFATVMFPVNLKVLFNVNYTIGGEDWLWISQMQKLYKTEVVCKDLYAVRFHDDRIGSWKKKFNTSLSMSDRKTLSYAQMIEKYKERHGK